jgi:hypothetical protein
VGYIPDEETVSDVVPEVTDMADLLRMDYEYAPFADTDSIVSDQ